MSTASLTANTTSNKIVATCPACHARYRIKASMSGRKAKCGKCQTRMRIPTLRAKLQQAVSKSSYRRSRSATRQQNATLATAQTGQLVSTKRVGTGMLLCGWANIFMMAAVTATLAMLFQMTDLFYEYRSVAAGVFGGIGLMGLIGMMTCCAAPSESRSRFYVLSAMFLTLLGIGAAAYGVVCQLNGIDMVVTPMALQVTSGILSVLAFYCFMIFTAKMGRYIGRGELAATARGVIWIHTLVVAVSGGLAAMILFDTTANVVLINTIQIGLGVATVANLIILTVLQFQLGSALRKN